MEEKSDAAPEETPNDATEEKMTPALDESSIPEISENPAPATDETPALPMEDKSAPSDDATAKPEIPADAAPAAPDAPAADDSDKAPVASVDNAPVAGEMSSAKADDSANKTQEPSPLAERVQSAEARLNQAEVEFLKAQIEMEQVKLDMLKIRLASAEKVAAAEESAPTPAVSQAATEDDSEGFIQNWLVLGPIAVEDKVCDHNEESCKAMLDRQYVPAEANPKAGDKLDVDGEINVWQAVTCSDYFADLSKVAEDNGKEPEKAAYLGIAYVTSSSDVDGVTLAIGSDDDSVWRLNGEEVIRSYDGRAVDKDQDTLDNLSLQEGVNVLSFTVLNGEGPAAAAARFLDKDGKPLKGLTFSLTPPNE